jgi:thioredoxin 1
MQSSVLLKSAVLRNIAKETCKSTVLKESVRNIGSSALRQSSFKIQDRADFQERVKNSKVPVVVDFFATYVLCYLLS